MGIDISSAAYERFVLHIVHVVPSYSVILCVCRDDGAERDIIDLSPGNQYILRYQPVSSLVQSGTVKLI